MRLGVTSLWQRLFGETIERVEAESLAFRLSPEGQQADRKTISVLLMTAIALSLQNFFDHPYYVHEMLQRLSQFLTGSENLGALGRAILSWNESHLDVLTWWAVTAYLTYVVIPLVVIKFVFRESVSQYGTKIHGLLSGWPIYLVFVLVMVPLVWIFSAEPHFQKTYPFLNISPGHRPPLQDLIRWEILYGLQFVALEFFFRGFLLHGLKHRFGIYSVFVMTVPYCMIHFRKPMPECLASIIAGVMLGFMSLKTRSIWLGAALHISVAWGMDFASLSRKGIL
jgi:membrane protease YdiL (CAAX protease family)